MARRYTPFPLILVETFSWLGEHAQDPSSVLGPMGSPHLLQLWAFEKLQVMAPPSDHLMFDYRPRVYVYCQYRLIGETVEEWTAIFQDVTFEGVRWTCPWWYVEQVTISSYMHSVPRCGLSIALAYYSSRVVGSMVGIKLCLITRG
ncbi:hypothetical protein JCGZ_03165 [Jatropha curcas]|uniref:Uncharacterized protein n=1 Tax=Jatropha curcas TaxID=180498 RepID=A0A067LAC6_JATCU|nr:hypothetical protein JCGZ_03165 [Jatropha curcas]